MSERRRYTPCVSKERLTPGKCDCCDDLATHAVVVGFPQLGHSSGIGVYCEAHADYTVAEIVKESGLEDGSL